MHFYLNILYYYTTTLPHHIHYKFSWQKKHIILFSCMHSITLAFSNLMYHAWYTCELDASSSPIVVVGDGFFFFVFLLLSQVWLTGQKNGLLVSHKQEIPHLQRLWRRLITRKLHLLTNCSPLVVWKIYRLLIRWTQYLYLDAGPLIIGGSKSSYLPWERWQKEGKNYLDQLLKDI